MSYNAKATTCSAVTAIAFGILAYWGSLAPALFMSGVATGVALIGFGKILAGDTA